MTPFRRDDGGRRRARRPRRTTSVAMAGVSSGSPSRRSQIGGRNAEQRRRLEDAHAERIGDEHVSRAPRLHEARHAERRVGPQLERIAVVVVETAEDRVDRPQPGDGLQEDAIVAHREVAALDEREPEVPREIRVLEVGLVVRSRREQHDVRRIRRSHGAPANSICRSVVEERRQRRGRAARETHREDTRDMIARFSSAYPTPDGACVRVPTTRQRPSAPRARSNATRCRKTPSAGRTPWQARRKPGCRKTSAGGISPSRSSVCGP